MLRIFVVNIHQTLRGRYISGWLDLPATKKEIDAFKECVGIEKETKYEIHDYACEIAGVDIGNMSIEAALVLAERLVDVRDVEAFEAILDYLGCDTEHALDIYEDNDYLYLPGITTYQALGEWLCAKLDAPFMWREKLGRMWDNNVCGGFVGRGYLIRGL